MVSVKAVDTTALRINRERLQADFDELADIGRLTDGGSNRPALSVADLEARAWFGDRVDEAGLFFRDDDAGNLSGVFFAKDRNAKTLIIGSHLDTVPNGGRFDGAIGVLAGLEVARTLREADIDLPFHLEVMNFTDEEGTWFSLLGSRSLTAQLPLGRLQSIHGDDGAFRAALSRAGIHVDRLNHANRQPESVRGYLEMHIEQGGVLDKTGIQVGIVSSIVGRITNQITFHGQRGHSGTTDPANRKDALQGAALFVTRAHMLVHERQDGTVINCGKLEVFPGTFNVVPEKATLLVECRHTETETLDQIEQQLIEIAQECATSYGLQVESKRVEFMSPAKMSKPFVDMLTDSANALGVSHINMASYAGHDAQPMSRFTETAMLFVPSVGGTSHNPNEFTHWDDVVNGANILLQTVLKLAAQES